MMKVKMKFRARCEPSKAPKSSNRQIHRFNCKKARLQYLPNPRRTPRSDHARLRPIANRLGAAKVAVFGA